MASSDRWLVEPIELFPSRGLGSDLMKMLVNFSLKTSIFGLWFGYK